MKRRMARGPLHYREFEDMLKSFRCQDLANLLAYANHSKNGKKSELYDRCIKLLENGGVNIQMKIQELYNNLKQNSVQFNTNQIIGQPLTSPTLSPNMVISNELFQQQANTNFQSHQMPRNAYHQSTGISSNGISKEIKFRKLAFFEVLHELNKPLPLITSNPVNRTHQFTFSFSLQSKQADEVSTSREIVDGKIDYSTQIQLRFCQYEGGIEQPDNFPANINVNVNGKPAPLPQPKPTSKPNADIIRPGRSVDITHLCKLAPMMPNKVDITWSNSEQNKTYCVCAFVVKKLSIKVLMDRLIKNCRKPSEYSRQLVKEKLTIEDNDFEIETSTLKASLLCPLMKCKIKIPGRSSLCKHVQCFDLISYLHMNEKKPTWNCPVCDRYSPYEDLIVDGLFEEILQKCADIDEIQFSPNGDWTRIEIKKKTNVKNNNNNNNSSKCENIDLSPIVNKTIADNSIKTQNTQSYPQTINPPPTTKPSSVVIDLTLDSDGDEPVCKLNKENKRSNSSTSSIHKNSCDNNNILKNGGLDPNIISENSSKNSSINDGIENSPASVISLSSSANSRSNTPTNEPKESRIERQKLGECVKSALNFQPMTPTYDPTSPMNRSIDKSEKSPMTPNYSPKSNSNSTNTNNTKSNTQNGSPLYQLNTKSPDFSTTINYNNNTDAINYSKNKSTTIVNPSLQAANNEKMKLLEANGAIKNLPNNSLNINNNNNPTNVNTSQRKIPIDSDGMQNNNYHNVYNNFQNSPNHNGNNINNKTNHLNEEIHRSREPHGIIHTNSKMKPKSKPLYLNKEKAQLFCDDWSTNGNNNFPVKDTNRHQQIPHNISLAALNNEKTNSESIKMRFHSTDNGRNFSSSLISSEQNRLNNSNNPHVPNSSMSPPTSLQQHHHQQQQQIQHQLHNNHQYTNFNQMSNDSYHKNRNNSTFAKNNFNPRPNYISQYNEGYTSNNNNKYRPTSSSYQANNNSNQIASLISNSMTISQQPAQNHN